MKKPSIIVVVARGNLFSYLIHPDGFAVLVKRVDFQLDGQTHCPLLDWNCERSAPYRILGSIISIILRQYSPQAWALVCAPDQTDAILENLEADRIESLADCVGSDTLDVNITNVSHYFHSRPSAPPSRSTESRNPARTTAPSRFRHTRERVPAV